MNARALMGVPAFNIFRGLGGIWILMQPNSLILDGFRQSLQVANPPIFGTRRLKG